MATAASTLALTFGTDVGHVLARALIKALRLLPWKSQAQALRAGRSAGAASLST